MRDFPWWSGLALTGGFPVCAGVCARWCVIVGGDRRKMMMTTCREWKKGYCDEREREVHRVH